MCAAPSPPYFSRPDHKKNPQEWQGLPKIALPGNRADAVALHTRNPPPAPGRGPPYRRCPGVRPRWHRPREQPPAGRPEEVTVVSPLASTPQSTKVTSERR